MRNDSGQTKGYHLGAFSFLQYYCQYICQNNAKQDGNPMSFQSSVNTVDDGTTEITV